ncbi:TPA: hypothetical protein IWO58_000523 [Enterococcus faecium]|nr:hypothetical protein [Enterococcus faecium]
MIRLIFIVIFLIICTANYFVTKVLKKDSNIEVNSFLERRANQKNDDNNNDDTDNDIDNNNDFSDLSSF